MDQQDFSRLTDRHGIGGFFLSRWSGQVPLRTLFWRDTILVASALNIVTSLASVAMLAAKIELGWALAVFFLPLPYNLFLAFAVWRTSEKQRGGMSAFLYQVGVLLWLIAATFI